MYLLAAAVSPVIIFLYVVYKKDTIKEPWTILRNCFLGGILCTIPAVIISLILDYHENIQNPILSSFYNAFVEASFAEELAKFAFLFWIVWKNKEFDQFYDGIIYAVCVSMGFAITENIIYVFNYGFGVAIGRAILAIPGHGFFGVAMGYHLSLARFSEKDKRRKHLFLSLLIPILLHGAYDFLLMYAETDSLPPSSLALLLLIFTGFIIFLWRSGIKKIKEHVELDKSKQEKDETV